MRLFLALYLLFGCIMALAGSSTDKELRRPMLAILFIGLGPALFVVCTVGELIKLSTKRNGEQKFD